MKFYRYIGTGRGIPGLSHRISDIQAKARGVEKELAAAVRSGEYEQEPAREEAPARVMTERTKNRSSSRKAKSKEA